jgi:hypothetical protein
MCPRGVYCRIPYFCVALNLRVNLWIADMLIWFDIWQDSDEDDEKDNQLEPLLSIGQCIQFLEEHER